MSRQSELLAALADNPEDTVTLGVLADLLVDAGDPRGEFIHLSNAPDTPETRAALDALIDAHGAAWMRPHRVVDGIYPFYTRGLVGGLRGSAVLVAKHAAKLAERIPFLHELALTMANAAEANLEAFRDAPFLPKLRALSISAANRKVQRWDALGALPNVHTLVLDCVNVGPDEAAAIVAAMPHIETLTLSNCTLRKGSLAPFVAYAPNLRSLAAPSAHAGAELAELIAACRNLRALHVMNNELGEAGRAIMPALTQVESIDLKSNDLPADCFDDLLAHLGPVPALELGGNEFGDAALASLATWRHLPGVTKIHFGRTRITSAGTIAFAKTEALANLRSLVLSDIKLSEEAKAALIASPHLAQCVIYAGDRRLARPKPTSPARPTGARAARPSRRTTGPKRTARPTGD